MIYMTHGKAHLYQPLFEATLGRRRGTCSKRDQNVNLQIQKTKIKLLPSRHAPTSA